MPLRMLNRQLRERRKFGRVSELTVPDDPARRAALIGAYRPPPPPCIAEPDLPRLAASLEAIRPLHPHLHASLVSLDAAQLAAVLSDAPSLLVRAPVGSGKTRVLVHRVLVLHLVRGIPLRALAVLTFTNRAADEVRERLQALGAGETASAQGDFWLTGTFHGVARSLLASALPLEQLGYRAGFSVLEEDEAEAMLSGLIAEHRLRIRRRAQLRQRLRSPGLLLPRPDDLPRLAPLYSQAKRAANAMDFDDLLEHATALLATGRSAQFPTVRAVVVDELQDCEPRELAFLTQLRSRSAEFFAVGDPHQAIYGWRGSAPEVFSRAEREFQCQLHALPTNYRSTQTILACARVVLGAQSDAGGEVSSVRGRGERVVLRRHHDPLSEAIYLAERVVALHRDGVPYEAIGILFRMRAQADLLREGLSRLGIPWQEREDTPGAAVRLLTLHASKGLEFRQVFLCGVNDGVLPLGGRRSPADDAEERRLLFVGLTRAEAFVEIGFHSQPHLPGAVGDPCPYLAGIPDALLERIDGGSKPVAPTLSSAAAASPYFLGQSVRHPRYGAGFIVEVAQGSVECDFGKRGRKAFPLALCPLAPEAVTG